VRKLTIAVITAAMLGGTGLGAAQADPPSEGFGNYGLCNAYYRGSEQGQEKKRENGKAFQSLESSARQWAEDNGYDGEDPVKGYCEANFPKPGNGNGNGNKGGGNRP
jgi:hypothetical protein